MTGHAVLVIFVTFIVKSNRKPIKMTPGGEPDGQLESSLLILVQGFSSQVRYDMIRLVMLFFVLLLLFQ